MHVDDPLSHPVSCEHGTVRIVLCALLLAGCDRVFGLQANDASDTALDLCATQPADPTCHDEDGDQIVDAHDNCPATFNPSAAGSSQGDLDTDGVGDACDPHPTTAGDAIVEFEPFATGFGTWAAGVGGWTSGADQITSPAGTALKSRLTHSLIQARHPTIDVAFELLDLGTDTNRTVGPRLDFAASPGACRVIRTNVIAVDNSTSTTSTGFSPDVGTNVRYVAHYSRDVPNVRCTIATGVMEDPNANLTDVLVTPGVEVEYMQVTITSIILYASSSN